MAHELLQKRLAWRHNNRNHPKRNRKGRKKWERIRSSGTISRGEKMHRAPQKRKDRTENILRNNGQNFP